MTPGARLQAAITVLDQINGGTPAEKALTNWARKSRYAGSKDRAAVRDTVFDVLRQKNSCAKTAGNTTGRALVIGLLRLHGIEISSLFQGGYSPEPLTKAEYEKISAHPTWVPDVPEWILNEAVSAQSLESYLSALRFRADVCLRVNHRKASRAAAQAALAEQGIETRFHPAVDTALVVVGPSRKILQSDAFRKGWVELQDASSQAAVSMIPVEKGVRVIDFCAGGGGKSLALAAKQTCKIEAFDLNQQRMRDIASRADRAGARIDLVAKPSGLYDVVMCDVPCSGSGTWRRDPDAKWRFSPDDLSQIQNIQLDILERAQRFVAPGGHLIYMTCSVLDAENYYQIQSFMKLFSSFRVLRQTAWPMDDQGDGFFCAIFTKLPE